MRAQANKYLVTCCLISYSEPNCSDGGAMLFLAGADHERYGKVKWTRRYLLGHRRILKKGDFTTPPVDPIFQKENGG